MWWGAREYGAHSRSGTPHVAELTPRHQPQYLPSICKESASNHGVDMTTANKGPQHPGLQGGPWHGTSEHRTGRRTLHQHAPPLPTQAAGHGHPHVKVAHWSTSLQSSGLPACTNLPAKKVNASACLATPSLDAYVCQQVHRATGCCSQTQGRSPRRISSGHAA